MKNKNLLFCACLVFILLLCCIATVLVTIWGSSNDWWGIFDGSKKTSLEIEEYLGFSYTDTDVVNTEEYNAALSDLAHEVKTLSGYDMDIMQAVDDEDLKSFLTAYEKYNETMGVVISKSEGIAEFFSNEVYKDAYSPLAVNAKERAQNQSCLTKFFGALYYGKHAMLETCREGMYSYVKNELSASEQSAILSDYGLEDVDDIKFASDEKIKELASDPELGGKLGGGLDWQKLSAQAGETAAYAYAENTVMSPFPVVMAGSVGYGGMRNTYYDYKQYMKNPKNTEVVVLGVNEKVEEITVDALREDAKSLLADLKSSDDYLATLAEAYKEQNDPLVLVKVSNEDVEDIFTEVPEGNWDITISAEDTAPVDLGTQTFVVDEIVDLKVPSKGFDIDPEILKYIGFEGITDGNGNDGGDNDGGNNDGGDGNNGGNDNECGDYGYVNDYDAENCMEAYNDCKAHPTRLEEGYGKCISAGGGCWDIGRPIEYENPESCPADYSGLEGNWRKDEIIAYCECIKDCKETYTVERDCDKEFRDCCISHTQ